MARLLITHDDEQWYDQWSLVSSYIEREYEEIILSHVGTIFPNYIAIKYNRDVKNANTALNNRPDLALIHKEYKDWWIVEVELESDKLSHVLTQVDTFVHGEYNKFEVAKYIVKKDVSNYLIKAKVEDLVERILPKVLVIVDDNNENWKSQIESLGAFYCTLQVFKNKKSLHVYRLDGDYPFVPEKSSNCKFLSGLPTLLQVLQPEWFIEQFNKKYLAEMQKSKSFSRRVRNLYLKYFTKSTLLSSAPDPNIIEVGFQGKICRLKVIIETEGVFLRPIGQMSFPVTNEYVLECDSTFRFYLKLT